MKYKSNDAEKRAVMRVADAMMAAARTAPKGKGIDRLDTFFLDGEDKDQFTESMRAYGKEIGADFFLRDAANIDKAGAVVFFGAEDNYHGLNCGYCGKESCAKAAKDGVRCAFAVNDLGLAIGSAVSLAADFRIDNRVMYSAGRTAIELGLFSKNVKVAFAVPLSVSGKSVFFDRG
ncbi:MAG: ferredoxin [Clostridia bacterium]|nr:ferredoxin [Clostridia bacterium]